MTEVTCRSSLHVPAGVAWHLLKLRNNQQLRVHTCKPKISDRFETRAPSTKQVPLACLQMLLLYLKERGEFPPVATLQNEPQPFLIGTIRNLYFPLRFKVLVWAYYRGTSH